MGLKELTPQSRQMVFGFGLWGWEVMLLLI